MPYDSRPVRVLVVDDEELVRAALRSVLDHDERLHVVGACDGPEAVDAVRELAPDLVLLDVDMPGAHGIGVVLPALRALPRPPAVAMLTALDTPEHLEHALRQGASGFLLKTMEPGMFTDAVRLLAAGGVVCTPPGSAAVVGGWTARAPAPPPPADPGRLDVLTDREREVLTLIAAGLPNADIAACLGMGVTTVKTHIGAMKRKLGADSRVALAAILHRTAAP